VGLCETKGRLGALPDGGRVAPALVHGAGEEERQRVAERVLQLLRRGDRRSAHLGRAVELADQGEAGRARTFYSALVALCERADTERPELEHARAYLAQ
jgi:hypothetical protein